jgi:flagellar basal-body rod protein FlgB
MNLPATNLPSVNLPATDLIDTPLMQRLSRFLDATAVRSGLIATNIANIDTPGYHARDLDFRSQLTSLMSDEATPAAPRVTEIAGLTERPDGNNVNIDREGLALGQVQLQFQTGVALMKSEQHRLNQAIHEGAQQ